MNAINFIKDNYNKIPEWVLRAGGVVYYLIPQRYRYGKDFQKTMNLLKQSEKLSKKEIDKKVDDLFVSTVTHAYEHVPFYKSYYDKSGVDIGDIRSVRDINKLPFIDKSTIRENGKDMIADDVNKSDLIYLTTSGSTGTPIGLYQPSSMTMTEWAYTLHIWSRIGYKPESSRLVLRGKKIYTKAVDSEMFYDPLRRELSCDIYNFNENTVKKYCVAIEKYKPEFIHGYMSAIIMFAKYVEINATVLRHRFKGILATSENVLPDQKSYVEKILGARVFSFYGHTERLVIAGECEFSSNYHVEPFYGYCELIDRLGKANNSGEIVATGFINQAMPLIRYRTGDMAIKDENDSICKCGRPVTQLKLVTGRSHFDVLINKNGLEVPMTAFNNIHAPEFDKIIRYKLVQYEKGKVIFKIKVKSDFNQADAHTIKKLMEEKSNNLITFEIEVVDNLPTQKNGKYLVVEQNIK